MSGRAFWGAGRGTVRVGVTGDGARIIVRDNRGASAGGGSVGDSHTVRAVDLLPPPPPQVSTSVMIPAVLTMQNLKVGMVITGEVKTLVDFGCFVDIGLSREGLIHNSKGGKNLRVGSL